MFELLVLHVALLFLALVVAADDDSHEGTEDAGHSYRIMPCGNSMECGVITVPLDWLNTSVGFTEIQFTRSPASGERKGTIFVDLGIGLMGSWATPSANMLSPLGQELHDRVGDEYDVLMWAARGKYYDEELATGYGLFNRSCSDADQPLRSPDPLRCFDDESQRYALFSDALKDSIADGHWTYTREWLQAPDEADARRWYRAQEGTIARCLEQPSARAQKYVGTAATVRRVCVVAERTVARRDVAGVRIVRVGWRARSS
ncbi:hypothetical protein C8Q80DRAFT_1136417 [Daedaleopsis nitida]|nr:hypothetical protein C8Q80DRAFT_1136417 [Daedaleopsis nitida]